MVRKQRDDLEYEKFTNSDIGDGQTSVRTALVDDNNNYVGEQYPLNTRPWEIGVPSTFNKMMENNLDFNIVKGQLNKPSIQARIGNEHVESSREVQGTVTATNIVGQIFKASKDNITALSLTLESASGVVIDNFESYANSAALQSVWVATGNLATVNTTIFKSGSQSMALPGDTNGDEWVKTITSTDYTNYDGSFDAYFTKEFAKFKVSVFIGDGTNTKSFQLTFNNKNEWNHYDINETTMIEDGAGTTDVTAITQIGFRVDDPDGGEFTYIDNLIATPPPGTVGIKLWNMGTSIPASTTTSINDGTQYTKINSNMSQVDLQLKGGKRLYHLHDTFKVGNQKNIPTNEVLIPNNYYIIELVYIDTDVDVYGPDTSFGINYYNNGYAFTAPDEATPITQIGTYSDIMFGIQSMQDVYLVKAEWRFDDVPNGDSDLYVFIEDTNMKISDVVVDHEINPEQEETEDVSMRPMLIEDGGKLEFYYNDDFTDNVSKIIIGMTFLYEEPIVNG